MASTSSISFSTARKGSMEARRPFISLMTFCAVSWKFQKSGAFIFSSSSLILVCLLATSKRVADGFHPRLEFADQTCEVFTCHDCSCLRMEEHSGAGRELPTGL